jgi:pimeloyl-ACP methyl ester carboxylesterase
MTSQKSTNGRSTLATPQMKAARTAFGLLERVAPAVGAAWSERLWFTLPEVPERARRSRVELPPGEAFEVEHQGRAIRGTVWGTGPAVYLVHGWGGWGLQLAAFAPPLVAAGYRVVAYDALSHGRSDPGHSGPRSTDLPEMADALRAVAGRFGTPYAAIAHSFGAAVTAWAMRGGLEPGRLVFVAAANSFGPTVDQFGSMLGFGPRTRRRLLRRFVRRVGVPIETFDVDGIASDLLFERGALPPLLAIHDRDDAETPFGGSVAITEGWPGGTLRATDGLGHRQPLWHPVLVAAAADFVAAGDSATTHATERDRMAG